MKLPQRLSLNLSLRLRLMFSLSITALIIWGISTAVAWVQVRKEVNEVFDAQQILFAQRLATSDLHSLLIGRKLNKPKKPRHKAHFDDDALAFAIFTRSGEMVLHDGRNGENFIYKPTKGFSTARLNDGDSDQWRIFWQPTAEGRLMIAVGQELDYREDLINKMVFGQMWIWFASLPLLLLIIIWQISRELRPLNQVSQQLRQRTPEDNRPLATSQVPKEILPLVDGLNQFFERTATLLLRERRFTADAAHELRSPLAALKIQTEIAQLASDDEPLRHKALANLNQGIDRATQLVEQLLTLSRLDSLTALDNLDDVEPIEWEKLIPSLISERYFLAQQHQIELRFEQIATPNTRKGQPLLLSLLLRNLIDNGIKYCPTGSTITVSLQPHGIVVQDNGGGVAEADLAKLGQRFYRPAGQNEKGTGLGLSIVLRIAELHQSQIQLENALDQQGKMGLKITLLWR